MDQRTNAPPELVSRRGTVRVIQISVRPSTWFGKLVLAVLGVVVMMLMLILSVLALAIFAVIAIAAVVSFLLTRRQPRHVPGGVSRRHRAT